MIAAIKKIIVSSGDKNGIKQLIQIESLVDAPAAYATIAPSSRSACLSCVVAVQFQYVISPKKIAKPNIMISTPNLQAPSSSLPNLPRSDPETNILYLLFFTLQSSRSLAKLANSGTNRFVSLQYDFSLVSNQLLGQQFFGFKNRF